MSAANADGGTFVRRPITLWLIAVPLCGLGLGLGLSLELVLGETLLRRHVACDVGGDHNEKEFPTVARGELFRIKVTKRRRLRALPNVAALLQTLNAAALRNEIARTLRAHPDARRHRFANVR